MSPSKHNIQYRAHLRLAKRQQVGGNIKRAGRNRAVRLRLLYPTFALSVNFRHPSDRAVFVAGLAEQPVDLRPLAGE